jgi:hypothetical protein|tara:strand:- start:583 stop:786 length:204 start_codon:yes stop_codon:yes gene_type:complete
MRDKIFKLILIVMFLSVYIFLSFNQESIDLILETNRIFVDSIKDYYDAIEKQKRILQEINSQLNLVD